MYKLQQNMNHYFLYYLNIGKTAWIYIFLIIIYLLQGAFQFEEA